ALLVRDPGRTGQRIAIQTDFLPAAQRLFVGAETQIIRLQVHEALTMAQTCEKAALKTRIESAIAHLPPISFWRVRLKQHAVFPHRLLVTILHVLLVTPEEHRNACTERELRLPSETTRNRYQWACQQHRRPEGKSQPAKHNLGHEFANVSYD